MVDLTIARRLQEAVLRRWAIHPACETLVLRGGLLTGVWVGQGRRRADDVDFLATYPFEPTRSAGDLASALAADQKDGVAFDFPSACSEIIFEETDFPGLRLTIPASADGGAHQVQIDVGFNDPIAGGLVELDFPVAEGAVRLWAPRPEVGFGWKLHGLVERNDGSWRPKDLADLWLIGRYAPLDDSRLREAIRVAFESRDAPLWRLDRLIERSFGSSRLSRKSWARFLRDYPECGAPPELSVAADFVARIVHPHWAELHDGDPPRWPQCPRLEETLEAIAGDPDFGVYQWPGGKTAIVYERQSSSTFPEPKKAATRCEFRRRQLRLEARGLTFDPKGNVIGRPYPKFFHLDPAQTELARDALALEKLDGSLVFPTPVDGGWLWRTQRGRSPIADNAGRFANGAAGDYAGLVEHCLTHGWTPLFEWCSRSRRIVLDHPVDRLVLTGIRQNSCGGFLSREHLEVLAAKFNVELVGCLGVISDPQKWLKEVQQWTDHEGCVLTTHDERFYKVKSARYRLLHRAVEGPGRDRARWALALEGAAEQLCEISAGRGVLLEDYIKELAAALNAMANRLKQRIDDLPDASPQSRKILAAKIADFPRLEKRVVFAAFEKADLNRHLRQIVRDCCDGERQFREAAAIVGGPLLEDG